MSGSTGRRVLTTPALAGLVVASMVGAGVFTTSGFALADLRDPRLVLLAWGVGAIVAVCGAASYGLLARHLPDGGGEYLFLARLVHPAAGFVAGWVSLLAGFTGAAALAAVAFEAYAVPDPARPPWLPRGVVAAALVAVCTVPHALHTSRGALLQNLAITAKALLLAVFVGWSLLRVGDWRGGALPPAAGATSPLPLAFATGVMWIGLSYSGFNAAVYVAGEARHARRAVPRAMLLATLAVCGLYLLLNAAFVLAPPPAAVAGAADVAARAAAWVGGRPLEGLIRVAVCVALATSVSSAAMAGPRVYAAMAADGLFPRAFAPRRTPPRAAVLLQGALTAAVVFVGDVRALLGYLGLTLGISSAGAVASLFLIRHRTGRAPGRFPVWPLVPLLYIAATLVFAGLAAAARPGEAAAAGGTLATGLAGYWLLGRSGMVTAVGRGSRPRRRPPPGRARG